MYIIANRISDFVLVAEHSLTHVYFHLIIEKMVTDEENAMTIHSPQTFSDNHDDKLTLVQ